MELVTKFHAEGKIWPRSGLQYVKHLIIYLIERIEIIVKSLPAGRNLIIMMFHVTEDCLWAGLNRLWTKMPVGRLIGEKLFNKITVA